MPSDDDIPYAKPRDERTDDHEHEVEQREAYEYWGYLFKPDKTGTDKFKSLLRGLKDVIVSSTDIQSLHGSLC
jgi:hypothetical protein